MPDIRVGIVGASGYTGVELLRLLLRHRGVSLELVTSESHAGRRVSDLHPQFKGMIDAKLEPAAAVATRKLDLVFLALPHGASMDFVARHGTRRFRVVDLSGDFRLGDPQRYRRWYKRTHAAPEALERAVFGLPEFFRDMIRGADLVANPGCYPTASILALYPLLRAGLVETNDLVIDAKSGVTGAGASPSGATHFPSVFGNFSAYGLGTHRHTPEIEDVLARAAGGPVTVQFTPHLLPIDRGILVTAYARARGNLTRERLHEVYAGAYHTERFVRQLEKPPRVKDVRGSNFCDVHVTWDRRTKRVLALAALDNLVKGAAGQAVQNLNVMCGLLEQTGLEQAPLSP